jgi:predicted GNAT family N-acyltransferase
MISRAFQVRSAQWATQHEALSQIRYAVFVREQGVPPELELDERDADATKVMHVVAESSDGEAIGTARMLLESPMPRVGRMAVVKAWRGSGVGKAMLDSLCEEARQRGYAAIRLFAQTHATPFYYKQGFLSHGAEFTEAGIPHLEMRKPL